MPLSVSLSLSLSLSKYLMGTSTLISPILSRSTNEEGVRLQIKLLNGWMTRILTLIAEIFQNNCWITIWMTSNGWISLDLAFDGWKAPHREVPHGRK